MRSLVACGVLLAVLAGCLASEPDLGSVQDDVEAAALPLLVQEHDHTFARLHDGAYNIERVGYHNGVDDTGDPNAIPAGGWYTELAVQGEYAYMARQSADGSYGGFVILDIRDPLAPLLLSEVPGLGGADIEISDDGRLAFFASQRNEPGQVATHLVGSQSPAAPRAITVVDISDKVFPRVAGTQPLPVNGPHTITYHRHQDGNEYLVVCTYDLVTEPGTGALSAVPATQRVLIDRIDRQGDGVALTPVSQYQITDRAPGGKLFFPHDAIAQVHPEDGRTYLYVAYWDKGLQVLDITDPADPQEVSGFTEFSPSSRNNVHQARPFDERIGDRHVTVTEPEIISADETGHFFFLDTTDPYRPQKLGHWTLPGDLIVQMLEFSPHNFDTWDGKVALAHNHAGLWVVDVGSEDDLKDPKTVGFYMPALQRDDSPRPIPYIWGVFEQDGLLYAVDEATGLHVLRYTGP